MNPPANDFTINSHFEGKTPNVRQIYDRLLRSLKKIGPISEDPKKTSIHLVNETALAGVATRKDSIVLTIKSDRPLRSPRIHKSEQTSARRFHHEVKLTKPADVDDELVRWLKEAYALSS
ncbi:MAG: hypothetical protein QOD75_1999 [Blastocatellia bacterium]|jgi:hypothetical protein|nr:hypothetical protein [Blastocatellia bacterium]